MNQRGQSIHGNQTNIGKADSIGQIGDNTYIMPPTRPTIDPAVALAKLAQLPTDHALTTAAPLPDRSRIVFDRNDHFTGRAAELVELAQRLKAGTATAIGEHKAAVTGYGGIGKTQLAIAFAHRYGQYFLGGVYWLNCADATVLPSEIVQCGVRMGLFAVVEGEQQHKLEQTLAAWEEAVPRLLIFDNCEDYDLLKRYAPKSGGSRILITSRRQTWPRGSRVVPIALATLTDADSVALLRELAPRLSETDAGQIAAILGNFPLALHLAGSYLDSYRHVGAAEYVARLNTIDNPLDHPSLQGRGSDDSPTDHIQHVAKTFAISYDQLGDSELDQLARRMLQHIALFAPNEPLPDELLHHTLADYPLPDEERPFLLADARKRLLNLGLVEPTDDEIAIHQLVASFVQQQNFKYYVIRTTVEQTIHSAIQTRNLSGYPAEIRVWLPHITFIVIEALQRSDTISAKLAHELAEHLTQDGNYDGALPLYLRVMAIEEAELPSEHFDVGSILNNLANLYRRMEQHETAFSLLQRALEIYEAAFDSENQYVATVLSNLAGIFKSLGQHEQAVSFYQRALEIYEAVFEGDHLLIATTYNNLAGSYRSMERHERALFLYHRAMEVYEVVLEDDHPLIATTLNNLAGQYYLMRHYEQAYPLYQRALTIREAVFGSNHLFVANTLNDMAILLHHQGEYMEALSLMERAVFIRVAKLGKAHRDTQDSCQSLIVIRERVGAL